MITMQDKNANFIAAAEVAKRLGIHKSTVNRIAERNEIGFSIGTRAKSTGDDREGQNVSMMRFFTPEDIKKIKALCHGKRGNPNFSKKSS